LEPIFVIVSIIPLGEMKFLKNLRSILKVETPRVQNFKTLMLIIGDPHLLLIL